MGGEEDQRRWAHGAFGLLGHEIRLDILVSLFADWEGARTEPVSYATLMDAVGMRDSGKFNYHLDQLRGVYVRQIEGGYVPTAGATALYRAVLGHRPTDTLTIEDIELDTDCPVCGTTTVLGYERGFVTIDCRRCEEWTGYSYPFPQHGVEQRDVDALLSALDSRIAHDVELLRDGQCPDCAGTVATTLHLDSAEEEPWVGMDCRTCSLTVGLSVLGAVRGDDRVADALAAVGIDPRLPVWELPAGQTAIESRDPRRVRVEVDTDGGTATIVVDEAIDVVSVATETV